jgi:hypothetical protein
MAGCSRRGNPRSRKNAVIKVALRRRRKTMNQWSKNEKGKDEIRRHFDELGKTKAVGYLPLYTITDILSMTADSWALALTERGLRVRVFNEEETCIGSGAMYVYDPGMVSEIMERHEGAILEKGWKANAEFIIGIIANDWLESDDPIMPFIRELFNDTFDYKRSFVS